MRSLETLKRFKPGRAQLIGGALILSSGMIAYAVVPNQFTAGTTLSAAQMNNNFAHFETRIAALETDNTTLKTDNTALKAKLANVTVVSENGYPTVRFSGVNVRVDNGLGTTGTANGTGNLIVGYNEASSSGVTRCTVGNSVAGSVVSDVNCTNAGGTLATTFKTGSHYIIAGVGHNYSRWGGVVFGVQNTSNYDYASVTGGINNVSSGSVSNVNGGASNTAYYQYATVSGGYLNHALGDASSVSGGANNTSSGVFASVSGGGFNTATGMRASVTGGSGNIASGENASVSGGSSNVAGTSNSSVLGGVSQSTTAASQTIPALP